MSKVFLSSTFQDLRDYRSAVLEALLRLKLQPVAMEYLGANPGEPMEVLRREIASSDIFVGVYAHRYGHVPADSEQSITEQELHFARSLGKPVLCYIVDADYPWQLRFVEDEPGKSRLAAFKRFLNAKLTTETFSTPEVLAHLVAIDVNLLLGSPVPRALVRHNLPQAEHGRFVGRRDEIATIHSILRPYPSSQYHLVVIDGIGGIGKTSLAIEAASAYIVRSTDFAGDERYDAVVWTSAKSTILTTRGVVPRQQTSRTLQDIYQAIASVLDREDINRAPHEAQFTLVARALTQQRTLLLIDNLETMMDERIHSFLRELPAPTKAIVTTRHKIDVAYPIRLAGLSPADAAILVRQECGKRRIELGDRETDNLARHASGVPLAIVWSVGQMSLGHPPETVIGKVGGAHTDIARFCFEETVREAVEQGSYPVLVALAVLPGPTTTEAIQSAIAGSTDLTAIRNALSHLETVSFASRINERWQLFPLVRRYVLDIAEPALQNHLRRGAARFFAEFLALHVGDERDGSARGINYDSVESERENIFALVDWCYANREWELVRGLILGMGYFPHARGYWADALTYWEKGATAASMLEDKETFARCTTYLAYMHYFQGTYAEARLRLKRAVAEANDWEGTYQLASVRRLQAFLAIVDGNRVLARGFLEESLAIMRAIGNSHGVCRLLNDLGRLYCDLEQFEKAETHLAEAYSIASAERNVTEIARGCRHLATLARLRRQTEEGFEYGAESLQAAQESGWRDEIAASKLELARLNRLSGNLHEAEGLARSAFDIYDRLGNRTQAIEAQHFIESFAG